MMMLLLNSMHLNSIFLWRNYTDISQGLAAQVRSLLLLIHPQLYHPILLIGLLLMLLLLLLRRVDMRKVDVGTENEN